MNNKIFSSTNYYGIVSEFFNRAITFEICKVAEKNLWSLWYEKSNQNDYSIYTRDDTLLWLLGYQFRPMTYIKCITKWIKENNIQFSSIIDHSCGTGFSSLYLAQQFPDKKVVGSNLPGPQLDFNMFLANKYNGVKNLTFLNDNFVQDRFDIVISIEIFEHMKNPFTCLRRYIHDFDLKYLMETHSFTVKSPGHFDEYDFDGIVRKGYKSREASLAFSKEVRREGLRSIDTNFWNKRPKIYVK